MYTIKINTPNSTAGVYIEIDHIGEFRHACTSQYLT